MLIHTDYIQPAELTGYARGALADLQINQFTLSEFLPNVEVDDLDYRFARGGEGLAEAATFRAFDAESSIASRPGITRVSGELPPVSRKIRLGEYDRLRQRKADKAITDGLYTDTERMVRAVGARMELARGQALVTGKVTIAENGFVADVDFGRNAGHSNVAPSTLWSAVDTSTPITDMLAWQATYVANNDGQYPGAIGTTLKVLNNILRSAEVRTLGATVSGGPSVISRALLAQILEAYGLPPVVLNDTQVKVDGVATRVIPESAFLFLPAPMSGETMGGSTVLGSTLYGPTAESLEPDYGIAAGDEPGITAGVYKTPDPVALWTKAVATALPVLANPNLSFHAKVLA
ncbi:major capsid protein [Rhodococcus marinonascens]|uniref:major capsid protein n=1 Tax=Rhodococcus marinonascens TaxID=38311 RepID=UPI000932B2DC|nr:major capsid protein [Rhodococcus marinonascens]